MDEVQGNGTGPVGLAGAGFAAAGDFATTAGFSADGFFSVSGGVEAGGLTSSAMLVSVVKAVWFFGRPSLLPAIAGTVNGGRHIMFWPFVSDANLISGPRTAPLAPTCLKALDKIANAQRVSLAMSVTRNWISAAGRFDPNVRPKHSGRDLY
jgi:hypothetical protein